jgi:hypothetical protein
MYDQKNVLTIQDTYISVLWARLSNQPQQRDRNKITINTLAQICLNSKDQTEEEESRSNY